MTTDITELAQSLKAAAEKATPGQWERGDGKHGGELLVYCDDALGSAVCEATSEYNAIPKYQRIDNLDFIALANPANVTALVEALVEALEKAQIAGSINNQWKPDVCPITGRRFFMWIDHPELGYVPTYGGPYDSYTIPTRDSDGEFSCERYDHDFGGWVDGECVGAYLIDDDEQCRVYELEQRIAELESRTVKMPEPFKLAKSSSGLTYYFSDDVDAALTAAGIKWEAE
ncbi:ead/Ea22-like family protein [Klebsiella michiganensis]